MRKIINLMLFVALVLLPVGLVAGQSSSANYTQARFVLASGATADSANYRVMIVGGQASVGRAQSDSYQAYGGFLFPQLARVPTAVNLGALSAESWQPFQALLGIAALLTLVAVWLKRGQRTS